MDFWELMSRRRRLKKYSLQRRHKVLWIFILFSAFIFSASAVVYISNIPSNSYRERENTPRKAVLIDGLSIDYPNKTFIESVEKILRQAGFLLDIYQTEEVNLDLLNKLPTKNYELVIFRVHGGRIKQPVGLFIGSGLFIEPCNSQCDRKEVESGYLLIGKPYFSDKLYFVAPPHYITDKLNGRFKKTIIIVMSCFTGDDDVLARAFFERGAIAYIGFKGKVSPPYVDAFTINLLHKLYNENLPLEEAFDKTKSNAGPDPHYGGTPELYTP